MSDWFTSEAQQPPKPELPPHASREWDRISKYLLPMNRVSHLDQQALTEYCLLWEQIIELRKGIEAEEDKLSVYGSKYMVEQPLLKPLLQASESLLFIVISFGLTPKSRDLVQVSNNLKPTELKRLMGNPGKRPLTESIIHMVDWDAADVSVPEWLTSRAQSHFFAMQTALTRSNMFTPLDIAILAVTCMVHDLFLLACEQRTTLWTEVTDKDGEVTEMKAHPIMATSSTLSRIGDRLRRQFGMAPKYRKILSGQELQEKKHVPLRFGA